jgi:phage terminase large subunit
MSVAKIKIPPKLIPVFKPPRGDVRYRGAYGGRGSSKSFTFAKMAAIFGYSEKLRILCTRELQNSIKDSFHAELKNAIQSEPWLEAAYDVGIDYIRGKNGTEFIFRGLRHNQGSIKSLAQIDICIVEEAEDVPESSWQVLEPTIRAPKSEIWVIWNPKREDSPTNIRFIKTPPPRAIIQEMNWQDNPWFPNELNEQRLHALKVMDHSLYHHIWEGGFYELTDAQVFKDCYEVKDFTPKDNWDGPYYGLDFGFSQDKTAANKLWIADGFLWVEQEAGKKGLELDATANHLKRFMPNIENHTIRADSARPESISYLKRHGLPSITGVKKGKGSVEDGISFIKSFDGVIIHPSCQATIEEFRLYSYKTDRLSGDVLPVLVDDNNHHIDAIRYALEPLMRNKQVIFEAL